MRSRRARSQCPANVRFIIQRQSAGTTNDFLRRQNYGDLVARLALWSADAGEIAFTVNSLEPYVSRLAAEGYYPVQAPHDESFGPVASFRDPDDNLIELVELRYEFKSIGSEETQ